MLEKISRPEICPYIEDNLMLRLSPIHHRRTENQESKAQHNAHHKHKSSSIIWYPHYSSIGSRDVMVSEQNRQQKVRCTMATARTEYSRHGTALFQLNHASRLQTRHLSTPLTTTDQINGWSPPGSTKAEGTYAFTLGAHPAITCSSDGLVLTKDSRLKRACTKTKVSSVIWFCSTGYGADSEMQSLEHLCTLV